jgi:DNA polymerase III subunit alpha
MKEFVHLHVHTQYSILDGASSIPVLMKKAKANGMKAIAITDHGNMFGVKEFHNYAKKEGMKCILGCEMYVAQNSRLDKKGKENMRGNHLIVLAKNKIGYKNLVKLVSLGWTEGFYSRPRIDKELLYKYHEGLIISTACIGGEIPRALRTGNMETAEKVIKEFKEVFGDDFYFEIQRHKTSNPSADQEVYNKQVIVNQHLIELSKKYDVKLICTNDVHFVNEEDAEAHDRLICLNTGSDLDDPKRMRYTKQEWFKTQEEMNKVFADIPEALENTIEIADKIEEYDINSPAIMPDFPLPEGYSDADEYLKFLTYKGAEKRYPEITPETQERLDFELSVIKNMGFPGYFLIVQDFLDAARRMGVWVGPGRGSAAGSVVAYCLRITEIDPLKYDLLFERFLNPDRISMPDIDIDFDDEGRQLVINYVTEKYGKEKVAHIITFGSMAAKSAIRDVARVQKLSLSEADRLAKLVPDGPKVTLSKAFEEVKELADARKSDNKLIAEVLKYAETLEGSVRNTGTHACGIIIGSEDLTNFIPLSISKDKDTGEEVLVTQYEGKFVEDVGMLKMDFLGLKTLSIMRDAVAIIKKSKGIDLEINSIPLDDALTYELYSKGETTGTFQFESDGMKKYLRDLSPNKFEDLIAMNALYRPGPMEYIPSFINRKNGKEKIEYDFPVMETRLKDTYGITVYQEQVMLLARDMAGFSRGDSDKLRKAMGKKQKDVMDKLKVKFIEGCKSNNLEEQKALKVWGDWERFAEYAFNKSHSTCYSYVAYQTAYLKAHYPAEFMAAVLSRSLSDIKKITIFMDECRRMGKMVLGPDVNESELTFTVNKDGNIRFGLGAIKGVGEAAVSKIVEARNQDGPFKSIYDFVERVGLQSVNKKNIECLALAGALDSFTDIRRSQYFATDSKGASFIENLIRYGNKVQSDSPSGQSLFGGDVTVELVKPEIPACEDWSTIEKLNKEKELVGIYISAHPLDAYRLEIDSFCNVALSQFTDLQSLNGRDITMAGIVTETKQATTKTGNLYGAYMLEDYSDTYRVMLFSNDFINFGKYFIKGCSLLIKGKVQQRAYNNELEFKIKSVSMLSNAREELVKSVSLKVPLSAVSDDLIEQLKSYSDPTKGKIILKFFIYDSTENLTLEMFSRTLKVNLNDNFIHYLKTNSAIEFKLN